MRSLRTNVLLFSITNFLQITLYLIGLVAFPRFLTQECGISEVRAGAMVGMLAIANIVAVFPLGLLSDRLSPRMMLQASHVLVATFFCMLVFVREEWMLWVAFVIGGIGSSGVRTLLSVLYYKYLPERRRSANVSLFIGIGFFGFGVGGQVGSLTQTVSPVLPFCIAAALSGSLIVYLMLLPDSRPEKIRVFEYIADVLNLKVILVIAALVLMGMHFGVEQYGLPKLIQDGLGISNRNMSFLYLSLGVCLGGLVLLLREFFETRPKHFYYYGIGLIISGAFQSLTFAADSFLPLLLFRSAHVLGDALIIMMSGAVISSIFPSKRMGGNVGFLNLINAGGQFSGAFLAGICIDMCLGGPGTAFGQYTASFTISGIVVVSGGLLFLLFRKQIGIAENDAPRD